MIVDYLYWNRESYFVEWNVVHPWNGNMMSLKHDVVEESIKAFVFRVIEPNLRVIGSMKHVVKEVG